MQTQYIPQPVLSVPHANSPLTEPVNPNGQTPFAWHAATCWLAYKDEGHNPQRPEYNLDVRSQMAGDARSTKSSSRRHLGARDLGSDEAKSLGMPVCCLLLACCTQRDRASARHDSLRSHTCAATRGPPAEFDVFHSRRYR